MVEHLCTARAQALRNAMLEARALLDKVHDKYQRTLDVAMSPGGSAGMLETVRREGRAYAQALTQYSNAAMSWLTYVDTGLHSKRVNHAE